MPCKPRLFSTKCKICGQSEKEYLTRVRSLEDKTEERRKRLIRDTAKDMHKRNSAKTPVDNNTPWAERYNDALEGVSGQLSREQVAVSTLKRSQLSPRRYFLKPPPPGAVPQYLELFQQQSDCGTTGGSSSGYSTPTVSSHHSTYYGNGTLNSYYSSNPHSRGKSAYGHNSWDGCGGH